MPQHDCPVAQGSPASSCPARGAHARRSTVLICLVMTTLIRGALAQDTAAGMPPVRLLIQQAQDALARGNAADAADLFEKAASLGEYPEAEVGEVRARLLAGQFRHAVTISNVVAGEHPELPEAQALLAQIEDRSGYASQALQRLHREQQTHPEAAVLVAAEAELLIDRRSVPRAIELLNRWSATHGLSPDLTRLRSRAALMQSGAVLRAGNGLIVDGGRRIVTLSRLVGSLSTGAWVRSMRGEPRRARFERADSRSPELAILVPETAYPADQSLQPDAATAQTSRLCFTLGFPAAPSRDPMLPAVTPCVMINTRAENSELRINIPLGAPDGGSPVFDGQGRLIGFASTSGVVPNPSESGLPAEVRGTRVLRAAAVEPGSTAAGSAATLIPIPELYERLAPSIVQVIADADLTKRRASGGGAATRQGPRAR